MTLGTATHLTLAHSFKLGSIRLTERFVRSDPLSKHDERRLLEHLKKQFGTYLDQVRARGFSRAIGTSGTILALGALALSAETGDRPEELRNRRVPAKALHKLRKRLTSLDLEERLHLKDPAISSKILEAVLDPRGVRYRVDHPKLRERQPDDLEIGCTSARWSE